MGWTDWKLWQWTSGGKPLGAQSQSLDYDVFNGDEAEFRQFLGLEAPPPSLDDRVTKLEEQARAHGWDL